MQEKLLPGELGVSPRFSYNPPSSGDQGGWTICHSTRRQIKKEVSFHGIFSWKDRGFRGVHLFRKTIINRKREVQRDHPLAGDMGVSPIFSNFPHEWGIQGVDILLCMSWLSRRV